MLQNNYLSGLDSLLPKSKTDRQFTLIHINLVSQYIYISISFSVVSTLRNFVRLFNKAHEENIKQIEAEKKKEEKDKETSNEPSKPSDSKIESKDIKKHPTKTAK